MPRKYKRKEGAIPHGKWSQAALIEAIKTMEEGQLSCNEIARRYGIPTRTLLRRFRSKNTQKLSLGKHPALNYDNENHLAAEIQKLEEEGVTPTRDMLRKIAFEFAEKLGLNVPFNKETRMAGVCWLTSFLERHPEVKVQKRSSLPSLQETDEKIKVETVTRNLIKHAETSQDLPSQLKETVSEHSHDSVDDIVMIKSERFDDESDDASTDTSLDNALHYSPNPLEDEVKVEIPECSTIKDTVKHNGPMPDESRSKVAEFKYDGMDLLFLGYAAAVKKLSRRNQIIVKQEISRIIAEAELSELE